MKYTHLVIAIPHSSGHPHTAIGASWEDNPEVTKERDRWTDWFTDELFDSESGGIHVVKCYGSRFDCDVERLEHEPDRICRHSMIDGETDTASFRNAMLSDWYQYRADLLDKAWRGGESPLIVDCHSFPSDLAPDVDVCIGFNDDGSRPADETLDAIEKVFTDAGYRVARNRPYGNSIAPFGYVGHSVMIKVSKRCYMDETTLAKNQGYPRLAATIRECYLRLLGRSSLEEAITIVHAHDYHRYFKPYLDSVRLTPRGDQTWKDYSRKATPEASKVMQIEQLRNDYRDMLPADVQAILDADLAEAKSHLFKEDVDYLKARYFIPVQFGGVHNFRKSYNYDNLPSREASRHSTTP